MQAADLKDDCNFVRRLSRKTAAFCVGVFRPQWSALVLAVGLIAASANSGAAQTIATMHGTIPFEAARSIATERADAGMPLELQIRLAIHDRAKLEQLLAAQQNPASRRYHKWLTPEQFWKHFGPSDAQSKQLTDWLVSRGFQVVGGSGQGFIRFSGTVATAERAFATRIASFHGGSKFGNTDEVRIPAQFDGVVGDIMGLNNLGRLRPTMPAPRILPAPIASERLRNLFGGILSTTLYESADSVSPEHTEAPLYNDPTWGLHFAPADFYTFYDESPLLNAGINGANTDCIAIFSESDTSPSFYNIFDSQFGLAATTVSIKDVGTPPGAVLNAESELLLDIEWSHAVAPGAPIKVYAAAHGTGTSDAAALSRAVGQAVSDNVCGAISISYDDCGDPESFYTNTMGGIFAQAASQGQTVFVSAGDNGADDCQTGTQNVNELSTSPDVVSVGGTQFLPNYSSQGNDEGFVEEMTWNDGNGQPAQESLGQGATGGGVSRFFSKPQFQQGVTPADGMRDIPDVAMLSSNSAPGVFVEDDAGGGSPSLSVFGGTSVGAPVWAGISKLIMQRNGGDRLGNLNPLMYNELGSGANGVQVFRDVVSGNNSVDSQVGFQQNVQVTGFNAGPGYDQVTGWGTVDVADFVNAVATMPSGSPTPSSTSSATPTNTPQPTATQTPTATVTATPAPTPTPWVDEKLTLSSNSLNFGKTRLLSSKSKFVIIRNPGNVKSGKTVSIGTPVISGPGAAAFSVASACQKPLAPKQSCRLSVTFNPGNVLSRQQAALTVSSNTTGLPRIVTLRGAGQK
ncbi:MAG: protease pro-enzyme activation domain-containing protein [Candidatus Binataceae bacterium]